ncbi:MAG: hypothetical protein WBC22_16140 [Sedimentisphaerales bacterium]
MRREKGKRHLDPCLLHAGTIGDSGKWAFKIMAIIGENRMKNFEVFMKCQRNSNERYWRDRTYP